VGNYFDVARISDYMVEGVRWISERNEIGSHGMTHRDLTKLHPDELMFELKKSKEMLENITGRPVNSFAYPYGFFNNRLINAVIECGYINARTFIMGNVKIDNKPFALRVTLGATSYGYRRIPFFMKSLKLYSFLYDPWLIRKWDKLAEYILNKLHHDWEGKVFHLVVHADSIELKNDWGKLEYVLNICSSLSHSENLTVTEYSEKLNDCTAQI
jgi:peptidoglycan/xylan/chitin deacetylase (PgdA/CDA1 family)